MKVLSLAGQAVRLCLLAQFTATFVVVGGIAHYVTEQRNQARTLREIEEANPDLEELFSEIVAEQGA